MCTFASTPHNALRLPEQSAEHDLPLLAVLAFIYFGSFFLKTVHTHALTPHNALRLPEQSVEYDLPLPAVTGPVDT